MDRWILSSVQSLIAWFKKEMKAYRLYTVVPVLVKFIDQLTNWYVRLNRRRLKVCTSAFFSFLHKMIVRESKNDVLNVMLYTCRVKPDQKIAIEL